MMLVISNAIAFVACIIMVISGGIINKKKFLFWQTVQIVLSAISNYVILSMSGAITNTTSIVRNILCYKEKYTIKSKVIIIIIMTVVTLYFNNTGIIGILPIIASITYTTLMDKMNEVQLKYLTIFIMILWAIYDFYVKIWVSGVFDTLTVLTCTSAIIDLKKKERLNYEEY